MTQLVGVLCSPSRGRHVGVGWSNVDQRGPPGAASGAPGRVAIEEAPVASWNGQ